MSTALTKNKNYFKQLIIYYHEKLSNIYFIFYWSVNDLNYNKERVNNLNNVTKK